MPRSSPLEIAYSVLPLLLLFSFLGGTAALVYEIVWFQLLELTIGSTAVSLGMLLAVFMGGTSVGAVLFARFVPARLNTLRTYGAIEAGIAVLGVLTLLLIPLAGGVYTEWSGYGLPGFLLRGVLAAACLLPPTVLMGATLPALARQVESGANGGPTPGGISWVGFLYGGNLAGAVTGCLLAGFYLLREYDVTRATLFAASLNAVAAATALALASRATGTTRSAPAIPGERQKPRTVVHLVIAMSGFSALAAEAVWTRRLALLFGGSVYTFSIILGVFLTGLGIGSAFGSWLSRSLERPRLALGACQLLLAGAIAWTAYNTTASLPYWPVDPSLSPSIWFNFQLDLSRAAWALLPPTLLWGASFPLALAAAASRQETAGLVAGVYAANTLGGVGGALAASLLLVTWMGSRGTEQLLIGIGTVAGLLLLVPGTHRAARWSGIAASLLAGFLIFGVPPASDLLLAHGRFAATWAGKSEIVYAGEGLNASVAVSNFPNGVRTFHVAGKIQASTAPRDMRLQQMLGHLTTLTAANPRSVLVIGCGAGVTAGAVSLDPRVERLPLVEIEPLVPQAASAYFSGYNFDVLDDPRVDLQIDDGRHYLLTTEERFDAITADPLDPWVRGAANLYTLEFFEAARERLNPGGVVTMYVQLFETTREAVRSTIATFFEVFPHATIWSNTYQGQGYDLVLVGGAVSLDIDAIERRLALPEYAALAGSLSAIGMPSAADLFATYAGRPFDLAPWLEGAPINRDRNLRMQYLAGTGLNLDDSAAIYSEILSYRRFPQELFTTGEDRVREVLQGMAQVSGQP